MADGRVVSAFWGGCKNPGGSSKRAKLPPDEAATREKEAENKRRDRKADIKRRFVEHRATLETAKKWKGPRKFEEWLFALAERAMGDASEAEAAAIPQVCLLCAFFVDVHVRRSGWHTWRSSRTQLANVHAIRGQCSGSLRDIGRSSISPRPVYGHKPSNT